MTGVKFITVSELSVRATAFVAEAEKGRVKIAITKKGKPIALLQAIGETVTGRKETVSNLKNHTVRIISELEKTGKQLVITRDAEPVVTLRKITDKVFSIEK